MSLFGEPLFDDSLYDDGSTTFPSVIASTFPMVIASVALTPASAPVNLSVAGPTPFSGSASFPLVMVADGMGCRSLVTLGMTGTNVLGAPLNMVVGGQDTGSGEETIDMAIRGGNCPAAATVPLAVASPSVATSSLPLAVRGAGVHAGFYPEDCPLNLSVPRGPQAAFTMTIGAPAASSSLPFAVAGIGRPAGTVSLVVAGGGGALSDSVTFALPATVDWAPETGSIDLAMPSTIGPMSTPLPLFVNGWSSS